MSLLRLSTLLLRFNAKSLGAKSHISEKTGPGAQELHCSQARIHLVPCKSKALKEQHSAEGSLSADRGV